MKKLKLVLSSGMLLILSSCLYSFSSYDGVCFPAGTKVDTAEGGANIEELQIGDKVLAYDTIQKQIVHAEVVNTHVHEFDRELKRVVTASGRILRLTPEHPLYSPTKNDYLRSDSFVSGDKVLLRNTEGEVVEETITEISHEENAEKVYNIETDLTGNYFAEGILAKYYSD